MTEWEVGALMEHKHIHITNTNTHTHTHTHTHIYIYIYMPSWNAKLKIMAKNSKIK